VGEWLERNRIYIFLFLIAATAIGLASFWVRRPKPAPILITTPLPTFSPTPVSTPTVAPLRVYVTGAVERPDVYILPPGSIVKDALLAAGGPTVDADLERINLALQLSDQQQVYVPYEGEDSPPIAPPSGSSPGSDPSAAGQVNINTASLQELDTLPGVGPAIAQRIIDYRTEHGPFQAPEDITEVNGIGPATFEELRDRITTR
jgi:competence protein ComEA